MGKTTLAILIFFLIIIFFTSFLPFKSKVEQNTITNLYDAFGKDTALLKDFGFSCITKYQDKTILFDAGSNADIFNNNVKKLGIDLSNVDIVVISHGHFDHLNGIDHLLKINPNVKIYFPYDIFWGAPVPFDATGQEASVADSLEEHMQYFDGGNTKFTINQSGRFWNSNIEYVKNSKEIIPGLTLVSTHSPYMGYFSCYPGKSFVEGQFDKTREDCKQTGLPELSLSMKSKNGEVLIVGCSHTGVEHIITETKKLTKNNIELVYGGFHLLPYDRESTAKLVNTLKNDLQVHRVAPAHCTGHLAFKMLMDRFGSDYVYAGVGETISFK